MSRTELRREWERRIVTFRASGKSAPAWCAAENVDLHRLRYWLRQFPKSHSSVSAAKKVQWLSVRADETVAVQDAGLVVRIGHASIEVRQGCNLTLLTQVVQTLVTSC